MDIIAWPELLFVQPAADAPALQCIVETPGKGFVGVVVADKAGVELNRLVQQGWQTLDEPVGEAAPAQEDEQELAGSGEGSTVKDAWSQM